MCWGIFPFLVPCLSRGVIWADSEQPVRVKNVSNPLCGLFKDRVSCVLGLLPQKLMIFLSRCIKAMLQKDLSVSCVCVLAGETPYHITGTAKLMKLKKNEDQSVDTLPLLRIGNKTPMEGVTETKFGAETKGWTI